MAQNTTVKDDPKQLADAQKFWGEFTQFMKFGIIGIAVLLLLLAAIFIQF